MGVLVRSLETGGPRSVVLRALVTGRGPRCVLLIHGFPFDHTMWKHQIRALAEEALVVAPDLRGHGSSGVPAEPGRGLVDFAQDLVAWLDAVGAERAVVAGLSLGGYVAFEMWRRCPERIAGLALIDTRAEADAPAEKRARNDTAALIARQGMRAVSDVMLEKVMGESTRAERPAVVEHVRRMIEDTPPNGAIHALAAMRERPDSRADLPGIRVPTLVVVGEEDTLTPPDTARALAAAIPGAEVIVIPQAGHVSALEAPLPVSAALVRLLARAFPH
jgi:3-oxoadipate enol-lactonase